MGGDLMVLKAVMNAHTVWFGCWDKELGNHLPKRIAVFAGGPVYEEMRQVQILGKAMKDRNVACDVISFGDPAINKQQLFKPLIDVADNNRNCNLLYVPPNFTVEDALFSSQIIQCGSAPFASPPVQQESSKQNIMAAATASYSITDAESLSSFFHRHRLTNLCFFFHRSTLKKKKKKKKKFKNHQIKSHAGLTYTSSSTKFSKRADFNGLKLHSANST
nr:dehydroascorbate reductase 2 [Tanacetum cinerariifolium]